MVSRRPTDCLFQKVKEEELPVGGPNYEIFVMKRDGTHVRRLTYDKAFDTAPQWSPDGTRILFLSNRSGSQALWTMAPDGTELENLTPDSSPENAGDWSPDSERVVFAKYVSKDPLSPGQWMLVIMDSDGTDAEIVNHGRGLSPVWSPNGKRIAFQDLYQGDRDVVFLMNRDETHRARLRLSTSHPYHSPDWQPLPQTK